MFEELDIWNLFTSLFVSDFEYSDFGFFSLLSLRLCALSVSPA